MKSNKPASRSGQSKDSAKNPRPGRVSRRRKRAVAVDLRRDFPRYPAFLDFAGAWAALRAGKGVGLEDIQP